MTEARSLRDRIIIAHRTPNVDVTGRVQCDHEDRELAGLRVEGLDLSAWLVWAAANNLKVHVRLEVVP